MTFTSGRTALFALAALAMAATPARAQIDGLEIIAPANPGSGFDQTSRAVQEALQQAGLAKGVQVVNIPGAGGTIGLAQLVTAKKPGASLLTIGVDDGRRDPDEQAADHARRRASARPAAARVQPAGRAGEFRHQNAWPISQPR